jgi:hypothetical protein
MPNGRPGDHPITDLLRHGAHPFPADVEEMVRRLHAIDPRLVDALDPDPFAWEKGERLEEGRARLRALLSQHGA